MVPVWSFIAVGLVASPLVWMAVRDHRRRRAARRDLLSDCTRLFDACRVEHGGDGFPRITAGCGARRFDVRLISDGMTIRRLPQLWLQVTELARLEGVGGLAVLVRPSGYEFFSLTAGFHHVMEPLPAFPREVIVRGADENDERSLQKLAAPMAAILRDPAVKEIAVTERGLRIVRQADEGRRGDYLLLRQAAFDGAQIPAEMLAELLDHFDTLRRALVTPERELARA